MNNQAGTLTARLNGRRIIVTGAASGIGRRTAELFAREGARLGLVDRDADKLEAIAEETGGTAFAVDITDDEAVAKSMEEAATALDGIDGVVNVAGIMFRGLAADVSTKEWRKVIDVNLTGT